VPAAPTLSMLLFAFASFFTVRKSGLGCIWSLRKNLDRCHDFLVCERDSPGSVSSDSAPYWRSANWAPIVASNRELIERQPDVRHQAAELGELYISLAGWLLDRFVGALLRRCYAQRGTIDRF
jgi:hypothetical protein